MRRFFPFLLLFLVIGNLAVRAEDERLKGFQDAFEKQYNTLLDQHAERARKLRSDYLEALEKLKVKLGRENNLKGAAQVLAEIEKVNNGEPADAIRDDADHRFKRLREAWEKGLEEILAKRKRDLGTMVDKYFKALATEKQRLTRAGKIKEALAYAAEEKRILEMPEVIEAREPEDKVGSEELALETELPGTTWSWKSKEAPKPDLTLSFLEAGGAEFSWRAGGGTWEIGSDGWVRLHREDWDARGLRLEFSTSMDQYTAFLGNGKNVVATGERQK